jgi:hypothetical protein
MRTAALHCPGLHCPGLDEKDRRNYNSDGRFAGRGTIEVQTIEVL